MRKGSSSLWLRAPVATLVAMMSFVVATWIGLGLPWIEHRLSQRLGYPVQFDSIYPTWSQQGFRLVVRGLVIKGREPFHNEPLALCDKVEVRWGTPAVLLLHDLDLRILMSPAADNVRGRRHASAGPTRAPRKPPHDLPLVQVLSGRIRAQVVLPGGQKLAVRVADVQFSNRGRAFDLELRRLTAELEGVVTVNLPGLRVEGTAGGDLLLEGRQLRAQQPGGGTLISDLLLDGNVTSEGASLAVRSSRETSQRLEMLVRVGAAGFTAELEAQAWPLAGLAPLLDRFGIGGDSGQLTFLASAQSRPGSATELEWQAEGRVDGVSLHHPALDDVPWPHQFATGRARGTFALADARLDVLEAEVAPQGLPVRVQGWLEVRESVRGNFMLKTPLGGWDCATLLARLTPSIQRSVWGLELSGRLDLKLNLGFDSRDWEKLALAIQLPSLCHVVQEPEALAAPLKALQAPTEALSAWPELPLTSAHPDFVAVQKLPAHVIAAFMTAEDAGFFLHEGFEPEHIRRALIYNLERGRMVRGASTLTQQVAKNLFLSHERTVARKLAEAVFTWRLNTLVPKKRVLELYLNLVELGPQMRGVTAAARAYFGKAPAALTPLEAAHLASLPPNPKGFARRFREGSVDQGWLARLYDLVGTMGRRGHLTAAQVAGARGSRLRLRKI